MTMKDEIKACLIASLELQLDEFMLERRFTRSKSSLVYKRSISGATQIIDLSLSIHPKELRNAAAVVYPLMEISIPAVDAIVSEMIDGNLGLLEGITAARSKQPIEFTSEKAANARWYIFQADSVPGVVDSMRHFLERWTMPLLDVYATADDIVAADERRDGRVIRDRAQIMRVIAATLICIGAQAARERIEQSFGSIGLRRRYQPIYDYLAARAARH